MGSINNLGASNKNGFLNQLFDKNSKLPKEVIFASPQEKELQVSQEFNYKKPRYSLKRVIALNLAYLLKTNVIVNNSNVIKKSSALLNHLSLKFISLVYHSILHRSAFLLCRQLAILIPRFCKKQRKSRRMIPFFHFLKNLIKTLFSNGFFERSEKVLKY